MGLVKDLTIEMTLWMEEQVALHSYIAAGKAYKADPIEDKPDETPFLIITKYYKKISISNKKIPGSSSYSKD